MNNKQQINPQPLNFERLLDTGQAARAIGVEPQTLEIWRCTGRVKIPYIKVGRLVRYKPSALRDYLEQQTVAT